MQLRLIIDTDGDAFESDNVELARILCEIADRLTKSPHSAPYHFALYDRDGNQAGVLQTDVVTSWRFGESLKK